MMELEMRYDDFIAEFVEGYGYELHLVTIYKDCSRTYELWKNNEYVGVVKVTFIEDLEREEEY